VGTVVERQCFEALQPAQVLDAIFTDGGTTAHVKFSKAGGSAELLQAGIANAAATGQTKSFEPNKVFQRTVWDLRTPSQA
jgi:hypothetical protein